MDDDAPDTPSGHVNLTDMTTISALVGRMQRAQSELDEIREQFVASVLAWQPTFELLDQFLHVAGQLAARLQANLPKNWPHDGKLNNVWRVLAEDGIPIVYVPRAAIVRAILDEEDYDARVGVLVASRDDVIDDCRTAINQGPLHPLVADVGDFVQEALTILAEGHFAGAQSLAVNLCDTIIRRTMPPRPKYPQMVKTIEKSRFDDELLNVSLAFRPLLSFYATWTPGDPAPPPVRLSRHHTTHDASPDQLTERNATVAAMLATSLVLAVSDWNIWLTVNGEPS